jgi:hypothetical protein
MKKTRSEKSRDTVPLRTTFGTVLSQSYMAFRSLKYTYVDKKVLEANQCGSGSENCCFPCKFADLRINHYKFADFRMVHLINLRICDCGMSQRI